MHDYVLLWNAIALELNRRDHTGKMNAKNQRGPTKSSRALAIVHIAMHDAFFGRLGALPKSKLEALKPPIDSYLDLKGLKPPKATPQNEGPAVSAAARYVLKDQYPDFHPLIDAAWQSLGYDEKDPVVIFGGDVGKAIVEERKEDGSDDGGAVKQIDRYWRHREDPTDLGQGFLGQKWGAVRLFSASERPDISHHPVPRSVDYNEAHQQVRKLGIREPLPGTRTPLDTLIGIYWAYDGASQIGTPPRLYNQIVRKILAECATDDDRRAVSARLLAMVNVAMADAGIAAWYHKYRYQLWRPVLGIREYDDSFWQGGIKYSHGLHSHCDPWWVPYGAPRTNEPGRRSFTPPFPAYPSGHATFGAAAFEITRRFFGCGKNDPDKLAFDLVSDEMDGRAIAEDGSFRGMHRRHHDSLLQAMFENAVSRVYLGVHWRFDGVGPAVETAAHILTDKSNLGGVPLGRALADEIFTNKMPKSTDKGLKEIKPVLLEPVD